MIAGVAGGIARHWDLDPSLVRIAFAVTAVFGGLGLVVYAICALVVPSEEGAPPLTRNAKAAIVLIGIAALVAFPFAGFVVAPGLGGLVVVGALAVVAWRAFGGHPDSRLLRASVVVLAVLASVVLGLGAGAAAAFGAGTAMAVVAVAAGLGLVVAGFLGGARWLILPALLLVLPVSVVSAADLSLEGGVGDRQYHPASVTDLRPTYRIGVGDLQIDLRDVSFERGQDVDLEVRMGMGRTEINVPQGVCVLADAHAGVGSIDLLDRLSEGVDVDAERTGAPRLDTPILRLDLHAGVGEIVVTRDGPPTNPCG
jgi:phage shock protein PspC (stress-responsive transcriptional regulator)